MGFHTVQYGFRPQKIPHLCCGLSKFLSFYTFHFSTIVSRLKHADGWHNKRKGSTIPRSPKPVLRKGRPAREPGWFTNKRDRLRKQLQEDARRWGADGNVAALHDALQRIAKWCSSRPAQPLSGPMWPEGRRLPLATAADADGHDGGRVAGGAGGASCAVVAGGPTALQAADRPVPRPAGGPLCRGARAEGEV